ncbi:hypothetical protein ACIHCQ_41920 [Streptomyces sp. NPDC052236]|uniref:hypothetical protein n=1 Tax=Streptomyces sp. NPDC052236 TaxID=3365686 RepID=UPI0037CE3261
MIGKSEGGSKSVFSLRFSMAAAAAIAILSTLLVNAPTAHADWAHDKCSYATLKETTHRTSYVTEVPGERMSVGEFGRADSMHYQRTVTRTESATLTAGGDASISLGKIFELGVQAGYQLSQSGSYSVTASETFTTKPDEFLYISPVMIWDLVGTIRRWETPGGSTCASSMTSALFPKALKICGWSQRATFIQNECAVPRGGAGGGSGGSSPEEAWHFGPVPPPTVTVSRFAFSNGAGVVFAKDGRDAPWVTLNPGGRASSYQSAGNRIGAVLDGDLHIKDGLYGSWHKLTDGGDVKSFRLSGNRIAFRNSSGVIFAKDDRDAPWATLNPGGQASDFVLEGDWIGAILDGSYYVKQGINGQWSTLAGGGDVKKIAIKGNRFAFSNSSGVIFAKDDRDAPWATLNPGGQASDFVLEGDWIGAILDGSYYVKQGINGQWSTLTGGGDVKDISVGQYLTY